LAVPQTIDLYRNRRAFGPAEIKSNNDEFRRIADVLRGRHTLSFIPHLAMLDPHPTMVESRT